MPRRIEVELTSARADGTWTWRAAGAREPKGVVEAELVPGSAKVGDVLRVEADFDVDGITIVSVLPAKGERREPERLELLARGADFEPVTSTLVAKGERRDRPPRRDRPEGDRGRPGGGRPERGDRRPRPEVERSTPAGANGEGRPAEARSERPRPDRGRPDGGRGDRGAAARGERPPRSERGPRPDRPARPERPAPPTKPKPLRLRPGRAHRSAIVRELPAEQQPIAEQVLRGGVPGVRTALEEQNAAARAEGKPEIKPDGVVSIAEQLLPRLRVAEWLDRAEAALASIDELDLGDLRSVVVAADDAAVVREESTRELAGELKAALVRRQDEAHHEWLGEMTEALDSGRSVRALRLSSRPPKAGAVFPPELRTRLATAAGASLTVDAGADRWVAVLEALAYSPVHGQVTVTGPPSAVSDDLRAVVTRLASLLPEIARAFGIEPPPPGSRAPRPRRTDPRRRPGAPEGRRPPPRPGGPGPAPSAGAAASAGAGSDPAAAAETQPADPGEAASAPVEATPDATEPTVAPVEPSSDASESTEAPVEPADQGEVAPVEPPSAASESTVAPVEPPSGASESTVGPVEPPTDASESTVGPVEPPTDASESTAEPVEPPTDASESTAAPVQATPDQGDASAAPVDPAADRSGAAAAPVEATAAPVDPGAAGAADDDPGMLISVDDTDPQAVGWQPADEHESATGGGQPEPDAQAIVDEAPAVQAELSEAEPLDTLGGGPTPAVDDPDEP